MRLLLRITIFVAGGLVALPIIGAAVWYAHGGRVYSVQTGSMQPAFLVGDAVLVRRTPVWALQVGDVVTYRDRGPGQLVVSHRIVSINHTTSMIVTKGDHNTQSDIPIAYGQVLGRVAAVAPHLGDINKRLRSPLGVVVCVYVPCMTIIGVELYRWQAGVKYPIYRLHTR